jgi:anti-sigma B factor antagonist
MLRGDDSEAVALAITVDAVDPDGPVVSVEGDLDFETATLLQSNLVRLLRDRPAQVTLDVRGLRFIDSTGLSVFVHVWRAGYETGTRFALRGVPPFLASILDITGVGNLIVRPPRQELPAGEAATTA